MKNVGHIRIVFVHRIDLSRDLAVGDVAPRERITLRNNVPDDRNVARSKGGSIVDKAQAGKISTEAGFSGDDVLLGLMGAASSVNTVSATRRNVW